MASSVNKVILVGNVGKDPELRVSPDGSKFASFSVATSESWKDKNTGEKKDKTEWHRIVIFNDRLADVVEKYVKKGSKLYIEGQLASRKWTDTSSGQERTTTEVVLNKFRGEITLLDSRSSSEGQGYSQNDSFGESYGPKNVTQDVHQLDDDIPF